MRLRYRNFVVDKAVLAVDRIVLGVDLMVKGIDLNGLGVDSIGFGRRCSGLDRRYRGRRILNLISSVTYRYTTTEKGRYHGAVSHLGRLEAGLSSRVFGDAEGRDALYYRWIIGGNNYKAWFVRKLMM